LVTRPEESGRIDELLAHGHKMVQVGYLAGARAYFRRAAEAGSADAALALGETYDQNFIDSIGAHGIKPDPTQARTWYERARELGSQDAKAKLGRLENDAELKPVESHSSSGTGGLAGSVDAAQKAGAAGDQN
jgi:TPR repeat protein